MSANQKLIKYLSIGLACFLAAAIIVGIIGIIGGMFFMTDSYIIDEMRDIEVAQDTVNIEIEINAAELIIKSGDRFSLSSNLAKLTVDSSGGRLTVREKLKLVSVHSTVVGQVILTVPMGTELSNVSIVAGAGKVEIEGLICDSADLEFGAGAIVIDSITVRKNADIETGAGKFVIKNGSINDLDLDLGVGENKITSALTGKCVINYGVGKTELCVLGSKSDYRISVNKGIGTARVDGESVGNGVTLGNGINKLYIDGGIGSIDVKFQ